MDIANYVPNLNMGLIHPKTNEATGTEKKAVILQNNLNNAPGGSFSVLGGTSKVSIPVIQDTLGNFSVSKKDYTVQNNMGLTNGILNSPKVTYQTPSIVQQLTDGTKKGNVTVQGNSIFGGNAPLGGNNTVYLPGTDNTVYLPFGGNNNNQPLSGNMPGSNPIIYMPGSSGTSNGPDLMTIGLIGAIALGGVWLLGRKN